MRHIRLTAALLLAAYGTACTSYQVLANPAASLQAPPKPFRKARVTVDTGKRFEVLSPRLIGDSIQGILPDGSGVKVPMPTVQEVEVPRFNALKTVGLILAVPAVILGGLIVACVVSDCLGG